ncbi:MAG: spore coat protein [Candidatus Harrisonbacteria bacterium RIFCSPLOWO2_02_FULL_41_11]|uniref:glucose-1-phosphate thymidylyltransferase n=1 Tax=Candidatus Harrisonbacteria bacterium RIFCSPHIGHO2_02_FULL_42_16 TaxID=1798404 RepID=A0A1G1ZID6_9BACT|nr:MAG: spore coat protein [Candidatus Harrisonbacteria bacterium RIFCSPHIGHO2_02_FULL_42_16]OGY67600.1 MAG: spore coat protein [Candidatus Harrisonbacteria bacterium RIFCSPLOWO2_02_FULL_41_11]
MKGIILAGGNGTRLHPLTLVTNKHLLPVYKKPMIFWPLETLIYCGIKDILIISGRGHAGHFVNLLGSGKKFGVDLSYDIQEDAGGIAHALAIAEDFANKDKIAVILGDNVFMDSGELKKGVDDFKKQEDGAKIFLKSVSDAHRFGVAEVKENKVIGVEEKPKQPKSNLAVTGMYLYDNNAFDIIRGLQPSGRGELEITDVNNHYIEKNQMSYHVLESEWTDAGTFDSLLRANLIAAGIKSFPQ